MSYLMLKQSLLKNNGDTIWTKAEGMERFISFPRVLVLKWI